MNLNTYAADEIRAHLARKRQTQAMLAKGLRMAPATLTRRLSGATAFNIEELGAIAAYLGVPLSALLPVVAA